MQENVYKNGIKSNKRKKKYEITKMKGSNTRSIKFSQVNLKKSLLASVEFNKSVMETQNVLCLATEPYIAFEKIGNLGKGLKAFPTNIKKPKGSNNL